MTTPRDRERYYSERQALLDAASATTPKMLIQRYAIGWSRPVAAHAPGSGSGPGLPRIVAPTYDTFLTPVFEVLEDHAKRPLFYRLNFVRQLSTTAYHQALDAWHSRLAHLVGTASIAQRLLIATRDPETTLGPALVQRTLRETATLVFAFVHDACHGPFGHVLDPLRDILFPDDRRKLDKALLTLELNTEDGIFGDLLNDVAAVVDKILQERRARSSGQRQLSHPAITAAKLRDMIDGFSKSTPTHDGQHYIDIVDSGLDADRLDYIWRDMLHIHLPFPVGTNVVGEMIANATTVKDSDQRSRLAFAQEHSQYVRQLLKARRDLYEGYYDTLEKSGFDEALVHSTFYMLRAEGLVTHDGHWIAADESDGIRARRSLLRLTDSQLLEVLCQCATQPRAGHIAASLLAELVSEGQPFSVAPDTKRSIEAAEIMNVLNRRSAINQAIKRIVPGAVPGVVGESSAPGLARQNYAQMRRYQRGILAARGVADVLTSAERSHLQQAQAAMQQGTQHERDGVEALKMVADGDRILDLHHDLGSRFLVRHEIERKIWKRILADQAAKNDFREFALSRLSSRQFETLEQSFAEWPLVFLPALSIPSLTAEGLGHYAKAHGDERLCFYTRKPGQAPQYVDVKLQLEDYGDRRRFSIGLLVPSGLGKAGATRASEVFLEVLSGCEWLEISA